jgi:predicted nucleotidyltransferase
VDNQGVATLDIEALSRRWREVAAEDLESKQKEKEARKKAKEQERREREERRNDAQYVKARNEALGAVAQSDGKINMNRAVVLANKLVNEAQRCIDAKADQMQQIGLRADEDKPEEQLDVDTNLAVRLCAECVEINKHVREVLMTILRSEEGNDLIPKHQDKLLELLLLSRDWSLTFDASIEPVPAWLYEGGEGAGAGRDRKAALHRSTSQSISKSVVPKDIKDKRNELFRYLSDFVAKFFDKKGCETVRISLFGSIAAHIDTPNSDIDLLLKIEGKVPDTWLLSAGGSSACVHAFFGFQVLASGFRV